MVGASQIIVAKGLGVGMAAFALWLLLGAVARYAWASFCAHRHASRARRALGAPMPTLEPSSEGAAATLVGKLEVVGDPCVRPEDGAPAGVVTIARSKRCLWFAEPKLGHELSFRAQKLALQLGKQRVGLEGPITLRAGAREWCPGRKFRRLSAKVRKRLPEQELLAQGWGFMGRDVGVFRSVAVGQKVIVRGMAHQLGDEAGQEGAGYRRHFAILAPILPF